MLLGTGVTNGNLRPDQTCAGRGFFSDLPLLPILGYRGAVRPPLLVRLWWLGMRTSPACPGLVSLHLFTLPLANTRRSSSARVFVHHWL